MKIFFSLILIIAFASHFGITPCIAQKSVKLREVIIIEFTIPSGDIDKQEVLINRTPKTNYETAGGGAVAGGASCGDCSREEFERLSKEHKEKLKKLSYGFTAKAWRMDKNKSNVNFGISTGGGDCQTEKTFAVYRDRQTKIQLDCGISLTAYYGLESAETN